MTEPIEKIVICFRMPPGGMRPGQPNGYLARARVLGQRAEALGATLCSWSAMTVAFAFEPDALEEAIDLVASVVTEPVSDDERWACGIARGAMEPLGVATGGARSDLAWGEPLVLALTLSRIARAAEALVHPTAAAHEGALRLLEVRAANDGGYEVRGFRLDVHNPWRTRPSVARMEAVRPEPSPPPPPVPPPVRPPPRASFTSEASPKPPPAAPVVPSPSPSSAELSEYVAARRVSKAFVARDHAALERYANDLRPVDRPLAVRMRAFSDLFRGDTGVALRALNDCKRVATGAAKCQASLALAVALAGIGNHDDALLEALEALARARELGDAPSTRACVKFLEQLAEAHATVASEAETLGAGAESLAIEVDFDDAEV